MANEGVKAVGNGDTVVNNMDVTSGHTEDVSFLVEQMIVAEEKVTCVLSMGGKAESIIHVVQWRS